MAALLHSGTSWLSQQTQAKVQTLAHKLSQREELYKHFIEKASRVYADSLVRQASDLGQITQLVEVGGVFEALVFEPEMSRLSLAAKSATDLPSTKVHVRAGFA